MYHYTSNVYFVLVHLFQYAEIFIFMHRLRIGYVTENGGNTLEKSSSSEHLNGIAVQILK